VEFANQNHDLGMSIKKAAIFASEQRLRAILMTSIATLVGFMPLLMASGAGSISRWSLGTAVFGGMLISTVLSLIFVPILYIVIKDFEQFFLKKDKQKDNKQGLANINNNHNGHNGKNSKNGRQKLEEQESKVNV
jgi:predicted RND superfamily exporter protein